MPTQQAVLARVADKSGRRRSADGGDGVTFRQLRRYTRAALDAYRLKGATMTVLHPKAADAAALARTRQMLVHNEQSADTVALIYFNQGVLTGDWNGPHISVIGAYDATTDRSWCSTSTRGGTSPTGRRCPRWSTRSSSPHRRTRAFWPGRPASPLVEK